MNPKLLLSLAALSLLTSLPLSAQQGGPLLDLDLKSQGKVEDVSATHRPIEVKNATYDTKEKALTLEAINALSIPYQNDDPLFRTGPQTWLLRIRLPDPLSAPSACLAGRWFSGENRRSLGLLTQANEGRLQFLLSADGGGQSSAGLATRDSLPANEWITIVAQYQPGALMRIRVFDAKGDLLQERQMDQDVPAAFFEDDMPFWLGAPKEVGLAFQRFIVWERILSETQLAAELRKLR